MSDAQTAIRNLRATAALREPVIREAIGSLALPQGSHGLDAGCGTGDHTRMLAQAVGPGGSVTGVDVSPELLAYARTHAASTAASTAAGANVEFRRGDVTALPFAPGSFDWAWSLDCVGHPSVAHPAAAVDQLVRAVRPGGQVAIGAYSSQLLLPGYPGLEARLNAAAASASSGPGGDREEHVTRLLGCLRAAGVDAVAHTIAGTVQAPVARDVQGGLRALIDMLWGPSLSRVDTADRARLRRLIDPESGECIVDAPDYYGFFTYSMFVGRRGGDDAVAGR